MIHQIQKTYLCFYTYDTISSVQEPYVLMAFFHDMTNYQQGFGFIVIALNHFSMQIMTVNSSWIFIGDHTSCN